MGPLPLLMLSLLSTSLHFSNALPSLSSIKSINEFNNEIASLLYRAHKLSSSQSEPVNTLELFLNDTKTVTEYVNDYYPYPLAKSLQNLLEPFVEKIGDSWNFTDATTTLINYIKQCDELFTEFVALMASDNSEVSSLVSKQTIIDFTNTIGVDEDGTLTTTMSSVEDLVTSGSINNIYTTLIDYLEKFNLIFKEHEQCDFAITVQDDIKNIYDLVILNEIRGFTMSIFALNFQLLNSEVDETVITEKVSNVISQTSRILKASKVLYKKASINLIRCDPDQHVLDDNCFRLDDLFTEYYANERQLSDECDINPKNFSTYNRIECLDETNKNDLLYKYYCPLRQCHGKLHNCRRVDPMPAFCESPHTSGPRYLWVVDDYNSSHVELCPGQFVDTMTQASCKNFMCQCSEEGAESSATRAVNMNPQMADIANNKVVTNVRFLKQDNMIHLQIEQGTLLPEGKVDPDSVEIVPVGRYRYLKNSEAGSFVMINPEDENDEIYLKYDTNYTFIRHDHNGFHLDEINVDRHYVITGVRLRNSEFNPETGLNTKPIELQVHATKFNYHKGILLTNSADSSKWITPKNLENREGYTSARELLDLSNLGDSMTEEYVNVRDSLPNQEIRFQPSSVNGNLGQTTIPYFDARPPVESSARALGGIGIIHRGAEEYGGFLAPEIKTIDHASYILAGITSKDIKTWSEKWKL